MKPPKLLIDADYFFYRAAAAAEEEHDYNVDLTVIVGNFKEARSIIKHEFQKLAERFDTRDFLLTFTDTKNFRKDIEPTYKGNRVKRKPCGYARLKAWGMETYPSVMKPGLEADDVLGILSTNGSVENFVVVSPDKDMEQLPIRLYNLKDEFTQTPEGAVRKLYEQALTGDNTDGYGGCRGVGPKKAAQLLNAADPSDYWKVVIKAYEEAEQTYEDALKTIRLARILQASDWDSEKQQPILFNP